MRKSINKTTVIIVLALFLNVSVGYALFSDTITIEGTATAQGSLDIKVECMTTVPDDLQTLMEGEYSNYPDDGYNNEVCTVNDDTVTYSVGLEYPGASKWYVIKLSNIGTITGKTAWEDVGISMGVNTLETYNSETNELISAKEIMNGEDSLFLEVPYTAYQKADSNYALTEEEQANFIDSTGEYVLLRTGTGIYFVMKATWPKEGYEEDGVYYKATQTIEIPFEQYNE